MFSGDITFRVFARAVPVRKCKSLEKTAEPKVVLPTKRINPTATPLPSRPRRRPVLRRPTTPTTARTRVAGNHPLPYQRTSFSLLYPPTRRAAGRVDAGKNRRPPRSVLLHN